MKSELLVSVVTNFLNTERFLEEAIQSVFAQTYQNWELILVDDGSTDGSTKVAMEYAAKHPQQIRYMEHVAHRNMGTSTSRNAGIRQSQGEYIALLDSDDVWLPEKLAEQVSIFESHPQVGMVFCNRIYWSSWNEEQQSVDSFSELGFNEKQVIDPPTLLRQTFVQRKAATPCPSDLMFRREAFERIGGFEEIFREPFHNMFEDQAFLAKVFLHEHVIGLNSALTKFRCHPDSTVAKIRRSGQSGQSWLFFLNWFEKYLSSQQMHQTEFWKAVQKQLWPYRHPLLQSVQNSMRRVARLVLPPTIRRSLRDASSK